MICSVKLKATKIRDAILDWLGITRQVNEETREIIYKYEYANMSIQGIENTMATKLADALNDAMKKIPWEKMGEILGNDITFSLTFINRFVERFEWKTLGSNIAKFMNKAIEKIDAKEVGKFIFTRFKISLELFIGFVETFNWKQLGKKFIEVKENIEWKKIFGFIWDVFKASFKAFKDLIPSLWIGKVLEIAFGVVALTKIKSAVLTDMVKSGSIIKTLVTPFKTLGNTISGITGLTVVYTNKL